MNKKELVMKYRSVVSLACSVHNLQNVFRIKHKYMRRGNRIVAPCALLKKCTIEFGGVNNTVIIEDFSVLKNVSMYVYGDNNTIHIGPWCHLIQVEICTENSGNRICIGEHTKILGKTHLASIEGTAIQIGKDCLFSSDIHFRTGDSHSVLDMQGRRINASRDITLGDHVWVGTKVTCLKGASVADHCILGACALVTGTFEETNCVLAGVPAKVTKREVDWTLKRIPVGETADLVSPQ